MISTEIEFGPVIVLEGDHKGRIGYLDDDGYEFDDSIDLSSEGSQERGTEVGYVYFGEFPIADEYHVVPLAQLRPATTADLTARRNELHELCSRFRTLRESSRKRTAKADRDLLAELHFVETNLLDRLLQGRFMTDQQGARVFISHSSKDKAFATWIGTDLRESGHTPWFDEWDIKVGESIPQKISEGLSDADFIIVVLSENSIASRWVEREWQTKYWSEVQAGRVQVLPALLRDCEVPELLKSKKYADFRVSYNDGLSDILLAINALHRNK